MHDSGHSTGPLENPEVRHEHSDVNIRAILATAGGLVLVILVVHFVISGMYDWLDAQENSQQRTEPGMVAGGRRSNIKNQLREMPGPHLEGFDNLKEEQKIPGDPPPGPALDDNILKVIRDENKFPAREVPAKGP